jgi:hypothetical protein
MLLTGALFSLGFTIDAPAEFDTWERAIEREHGLALALVVAVRMLSREEVAARVNDKVAAGMHPILPTPLSTNRTDCTS